MSRDDCITGYPGTRRLPVGIITMSPVASIDRDSEVAGQLRKRVSTRASWRQKQESGRPSFSFAQSTSLDIGLLDSIRVPDDVQSMYNTEY